MIAIAPTSRDRTCGDETVTEEQKQPDGEATAQGTPGSGWGGEPVAPGSTTPAPEAPGAEPPIPGSITPAPETPGAAPVATPTDQGDGAGARIDPAPDPSGTPSEAGAVTDATSTTDADVTLESPAADATTPVDPATAAEPVDPADVAAPEVGASVTASTAADVIASSEAPLDAAAAAPSADPAAAAPAGALSSERIQLVGESGQALTLGVRTPLGKHAVRQFGDDFNVWDTEQCVIEREADGAWHIVPGAATTNETLLNGERITAPAALHDGDVVSVGRAEKGISRLPLTVRTA